MRLGLFFLEASATRLVVLVPYNAHAGMGGVSLRVDHKETIVADTFHCISLWETITVQLMTRFSIPSLVIGREVYYGTGRAENTVFINDFYTYDPLSMTWQKTGSTPGNPRAGAVFFSLEGRGYLGGGNSSVGELTDFWEFDPSTESWTPKQDFPGIKTINMPFFCINGKAYVLEAKRIFEPYRHLWEYTPQTDTWVEKSQLPVKKTGTFYGFSSGPFGFIVAGNETWKYNPAEDTWKRIADVPVINHDGVTFSDEHSGYLSAYPWLCTYTTPL